MIYENERMVSAHFDSIIELMEERPSKVGRNASQFRELIVSGKNGGRRWYGPTNSNSKSVVDHALLGDAELYERHVQQMVTQLEKEYGYRTMDYEQQITSVRRRKVRKELGDELDIHRVYQGDLQRAWTTTERIEVDHKHHLVTLMIDLVDNANQDVVPTLWKAAVVIYLKREIERAGKSVRILAGSCAEGTFAQMNKLVTTSIVIKEYNQQLNFERLAAMSHLGFFRTFGFAAKYTTDHRLQETLGYARGMSKKSLPINITEEEAKGHTRVVIVGAPKSLLSAKSSISASYRQMESFAEGRE